MAVIFHMTVCVCWSVCCGLPLIHHLDEGGLSENVKHFGVVTGWLVDKKCWEVYWWGRGLLKKGRKKYIKNGPFFSQSHLREHMHTCIHNETRRGLCCHNKQSGGWHASREASLKSAVFVKTASCCLYNWVISKLGSLGGNTCREPWTSR